jgi:tripartite-type tricarboxylate transporter receptor subunit TctC
MPKHLENPAQEVRLGRLAAGLCVAAALVPALVLSWAARAEEAAFYRGKTIRIVISTGVAGGYAEYARLLADHMGAHIAGGPSFIVQSMPGAGGLLAANYLYGQAPQDGTTLGMVHSSVPLMPLWGNKGARFDTLKFNWIGSLDRVDDMCIAWHTSPVKTWADLLIHDFTVGSSGAGSQMDVYPTLLNRLFGTRFKVVAGYKDGTDVYLAMERGEVEGRCGGQLTVIKSTRPRWLAEHLINVPIVIAEKRSPDFPDTPSIMEFVHDEATRQQLDLLMMEQNLDRPVMLPPGVPAGRVQELRDAFDATVADPAFLADVARQNLHVDPVRGEDMAKALARAFALPADVIAGARELMGGR